MRFYYLEHISKRTDLRLSGLNYDEQWMNADSGSLKSLRFHSVSGSPFYLTKLPFNIFPYALKITESDLTLVAYGIAQSCRLCRGVKGPASSGAQFDPTFDIFSSDPALPTYTSPECTLREHYPYKSLKPEICNILYISPSFGSSTEVDVTGVQYVVTWLMPEEMKVDFSQSSLQSAKSLQAMPDPISYRVCSSRKSGGEARWREVRRCGV